MKKLTVNLLVAFVLFNLLLGCGVGLEQSRNNIEPMFFEKEKWSNSDAEMRWKYRPGMARYLINKKVLIGKSKADIYEMLGEENTNNYDKEIDSKYKLEEFYGSNIDPIAFEYLRIYFDESDKVERVEIDFRKTGDWIE